MQAAGAPLTYKQAGVDIDAGDELVRRIKAMNPSLNTGFSGMVPFGDSYLVSGTDGVGTKLKLAFDMDKHDTVGRSAGWRVAQAGLQGGGRRRARTPPPAAPCNVPPLQPASLPACLLAPPRWASTWWP